MRFVEIEKKSKKLFHKTNEDLEYIKRLDSFVDPDKYYVRNAALK